MKNFLLLLVAFATISLTAQVTVFEDDFESYDDFIIENIGSWTLVDVDLNGAWGDATYDYDNESYTGSFIIFNPSATAPSALGTNLDVHGGDKGIYCVATNPANGATNDDWLISPQITLTTNGALSFWVRSLTLSFGADRFRVLVSTTDTDVANFTEVATSPDLSNGNPYQEAPDVWTEVTADLSAFDGQSVYIAINCISNDSFYLMVDDFKVEADTSAAVDDNVLASSVSIYPTAVDQDFTINNRSTIALNNASIYDVNGRLIAQHNLNSLVGEKTINVSNLTTGIYFVELNSNNGKTVKKIIKK